MRKPITKKKRYDDEPVPEDELNASSVCDFTGLIPSAVKDDIEQDSYEELYPRGFHN